MHYDAVVIGLGVMGAAALAELASRGLKVCGIERFDIPHAFGSSHGGSRVTRKAYYEDPAYVPLLEASWDAWLALERDHGERLLLPTGGLHFGPADSPDLLAVQAVAKRFGLAHTLLDRTELARRFPRFRLGNNDLALFERDAGVLLPERCVTALVARALRLGATVHARSQAHLDPGADLSENGQPGFARPSASLALRIDGPGTTTRISCDRLVLALGPWWPEAARLGLRCPIPLTVTRQVQLWLGADDLAAFSPDHFPIFMRYAGPNDPSPLVYGLPEATFPGVKLAVHAPGESTHPDTIDRALREADLAPIRDFAARHLVGVSTEVLGARACLYSMSPDTHFGLGPHPDDKRLICALGFSGHGFKLAPAVGRLLADLVEGRSAPALFALDRFDSALVDR